MSYESLEKIRNRILEFKKGVIGRETLNKWADNALQEIMHENETMYINNLVARPFLSALSIENDSWERCTDEEMDSFLDTIEGKKPLHFTTFIKLPNDSVCEDISKIADCINGYKNNNCFSESDRDLIDEMQIAYTDMKVETLKDLLICNALYFISYLPKDRDLSFEIEADGYELRLDYVMDKLQSIMKALMGEECIHVSVCFNNGNVITSLT